MVKHRLKNYYYRNNIPILIILALSYAGGVLVHLFFSACFLRILLVLVFVIFGVFIKFKKVINTLFLGTLFLGIGFLSAWLHKPNSEHLLYTYSTKNILVGLIDSDIQKTKSGYYKFTVATKIQVHNRNKVKTNGSILVYTKTLPEKAFYNNYIILKSNLTPISDPQNPNEFNFKRYLAFHHIYHQTFCNAHDLIIIPNKNFSIKRIAYSTKNKLIKVLLKGIDTKKERSIISALILGQRDELDGDTIADYSASGAMHVLAVSGLHVGILLYIIRLLFRKLLHNKVPNWIQLIITLFLIWCFAFITGLSASVVRAAFMFSFILVGTFYRKSTSIYTILAASALCMTTYNPNIITEVGFQLSYSAVIGIIYFTPDFQKLFPDSKWGIINQIRNISCVSISAQLATFPIGLLYFHQFPTYFIFSNLLVIPCAFLIVGTGLLKLTLSFIPFLDVVFAKLLWCFSWLLNETTHLIASFPLATISEIDLSISETYLLYVLIVYAFLLVFKQKHKLATTTLLLSILLSCSFVWEHFQLLHQKELIIYNVKNYSAIDLINKKQHQFICNKSLFENEDKMQFHIKHSWYHKNLHQPIIDTSDKKIRTLFLDHKSVTQINYKIKPQKKVSTDYLIISNNSLDLEEIDTNFKYKKVIYDSSNSNDFLSCIRNSPLYTSSVYIVSEQGSIIIQF